MAHKPTSILSVVHDQSSVSRFSSQSTAKPSMESNRLRNRARTAKPKAIVEDRYNKRQWRQLKSKQDMTPESIQSYVDSDNDSDYLTKGLNVRVQGDISHLPKELQVVVKRQRQLAREQGGISYIGPLKGVKAKI